VDLITGATLATNADRCTLKMDAGETRLIGRK
jgi:hypothetical protein